MSPRTPPWGADTPPWFPGTPTYENVLKNKYGIEPKPCKPGKVRDPVTGRCRKAVNNKAVNKPKPPCKPGKIRDPVTGRCRKPVNNNPAPKPCKHSHQMRDPFTGRCRNALKVLMELGYLSP